MRHVTIANDLSVYSPDYANARARFLEAASQVGAELSSYAMENRAADGELLTIDVAVVGGADPDQAVVVSSGLHGVEGFFGSAVQLAWLRAMASGLTLPFAGKLVLVHALNPYGFHHLRRFDAENVDLNRNFLLKNEAYAGLPDGYRELDSLLNPPGPPTRFEAFPLRALFAICRHGLSKLKATTATGQYEYPQGLFFGGHHPAESTRIVQKHFSQWIGDTRHVVHLDLHTGLGKSGRAKLLLTEPPGAPELTWYVEQFGESAVESLAPSGGIAYAARGGMGSWLRENCADRRYRFFVAELGTHAVLRVFAALRAENRAFQACPPGDPRLVHAQRELVECFCPASKDWRHQALARSIEIIGTAQRAVGELRIGS